MSPRLAVMVLVLFAAGCAGLPECDAPQPYHAARSIPPVQAPDGLAEPRPNPAYRIPGEAEFLARNPDYRGGGCLPVPPEVVKRPLTEEGELLPLEEPETDEEADEPAGAD